MKKIFLIYGYGQIGKKHHKYLRELYKESKFFFVSSRKNKPKHFFSDLSSLKDIKFDLIIISNDTSLHLSTLIILRKYFNTTPILVEKPLLINLKNYNLSNNVYVNYNLRFHPLIHKLKKLIKNNNIFYCNMICHSYLPSWRNKDYRFFYSSSFKRGGGVLYDLSHEFDLLNFFFNKFKIIYSINKKISGLNINTDDYLQASGIFKNTNKHFNISLTYFSKINKREIFLEGKNISIHACLIKNQIIIIKNQRKKIFKLNGFKIKNTFKNTYKAILNNKKFFLADLNNSIFLTKIFNKIKKNNL